jgi:class 3 adenylate cyclase
MIKEKEFQIVSCASCSAEIPEHSKFCLQCGSPVSDSPETKHPKIDQLSLIKDYIPPHLASKILDAGKKIESERRHVTIMFADVTGFTELSEKIDPEILSTILNDCFKGLISVIHKYEGTIDKFIGDAIMAIFGAPLAHENDPERAMRCALEMMTDIRRFNALSNIKLPNPISLHIGMHSGMVIAGNVGSDLRMSYTVVGDTVNLASRLANLASSGEIFLSEDTHRLVSNIIIAEGPHPTAVKGKTKAVNIYKLKALKQEIKKGEQLSKSKTFVGRKKEIRIIQNALEHASRKSEIRLFVRGEAGVGKTHLKDEVIKFAQQKDMAIAEGVCSSFEVNTPYFLWNTLLKSMLNINFSTPEVEARTRLNKLLSFLELQEDEPYLTTLLSIRDEQILLEEEESRKQRIFNATSRFLDAYAIRYSSILILEDLHWIDKFSQELLEFVFKRQNAIPTLILCLYRDEYKQDERITHTGQLINLNRLDRNDAINLMKRYLGVDTVPQKLENALLKRSEGNPFYIQEILKTLIDDQIIWVENNQLNLLTENIEAGIPTTIQGVIMARIDRLQESIKRVLFGASVIGREFSKPLLEEVIGGKTDLSKHLLELKTLELILEKEEVKEFEYLFKHYLIQEVAYNTILVNKRKELHASIAHAIEMLYANRLSEFYELLSFHYEKAEHWDKAAEYLSRSGHKVKQMYSKDESKEFFERKEVALKKLYQSEIAKGSFWATLKAIVLPLIAMLIPILPIFTYLLFLGKTNNTNQIEMIIVGCVASLLCIWFAISLWFLGIIPFLRRRPKVYDLMENEVNVIFQDGSNLSIPFKDISTVRFYNPEVNSSRAFLRKIIDPMSRILITKPITFKVWLKEIVLNVFPPYSFAFSSKQSEIYIIRREGHRFLRVLIPWFNTPTRSKDISLLPFAPKEFFDQFKIAFAKWKK